MFLQLKKAMCLDSGGCLAPISLFETTHPGSEENKGDETQVQHYFGPWSRNTVRSDLRSDIVSCIP